MTEKQVCEMCDNYQIDKACEIKDKCELRAIVKENKKLKEELKSVKQELKQMKIQSSWEKYPDMMGK